MLFAWSENWDGNAVLIFKFEINFNLTVCSKCFFDWLLLVKEKNVTLFIKKMQADEKFFQTEFQEKAYPWNGPFWPALTIYHISPLLCFIMHPLIRNTSQQIPETANLQCSCHARYTQSISVVVRIMLRRFWGLGEMLDILLNCNKKN